MFEAEFQINRFLLKGCRNLAADIPEERMTEQPLPHVNHPIWILGHLAWSADLAAESLGADQTLTAEWIAMFGPGSDPAMSRAQPPAKNVMLQRLEQSFDRLRRYAAAATPAQLAEPTTHPQLKRSFPTRKDQTGFLLTGHLAFHMGQLSAWRRMIGMPYLF